MPTTLGPSLTVHLPSMPSWKQFPHLPLKTSCSSIPPNVRLYLSQDRAVMLNFNYPWMVLLFPAMMVPNA